MNWKTQEEAVDHIASLVDVNASNEANLRTLHSAFAWNGDIRERAKWIAEMSAESISDREDIPADEREYVGSEDHIDDLEIALSDEINDRCESLLDGLELPEDFELPGVTVDDLNAALESLKANTGWKDYAKDVFAAISDVAAVIAEDRTRAEDLLSASRELDAEILRDQNTL